MFWVLLDERRFMRTCGIALLFVKLLKKFGGPIVHLRRA